MCRLLGYLGETIPLHLLLEKPDHSLIIQSYQPQEMTSGVVNADGFGIGWYDIKKQKEPFLYRSVLPIWNDINLPHLSRYIESNCMLANIRNATSGNSLDLSNSHPFSQDQIMAIHNGSIQNFRRSLYRVIRSQLDDTRYQNINGNTDSEHIFALILQILQLPEMTLATALQKSLGMILNWAKEYQVSASLNLIITDGEKLIASRCAIGTAVPSLYWLKSDRFFPNSALVASERLFFSENWQTIPENSIIEINSDFSTQIYEIFL